MTINPASDQLNSAISHADGQPETAISEAWPQRVAAADWTQLAAELDSYGCALTPPLLTPDETDQIAALYDQDDRFRATVNMGRHRFGSGEYRYFRRPFPAPVEQLRRALYPRLLPIARDWAAGSAAPPRGRTRWMSGWPCATRPASASPPRSC